MGSGWIKPEVVQCGHPSYGYGGEGCPEIINNAECSWEINFGPVWEQKFAIGTQWFTLILSILFFFYYVYQTYRSTCGWEEMYVVCIETLKVILELTHEYDPPASIYQPNGEFHVWLRYGEWLLTCPVILIHLSNITGLNEEYNKRTMRLLVSDIGTIVMGVTTASSSGWLKGIFFPLGLCYGSITFFTAARIYIESFHQVPKGICRKLVQYMAYMFYASWCMFPILFLAGPEGLGHLSTSGSTIAHTFADMLSKNLWGIVGNFLRVKIHEHILKYGDLRKTTKVTGLGQETEVETFVDEEDEETTKHSTADYAKRQSFIRMRDQMQSKGVDVRASLDHHVFDQEMGGMDGGFGNKLAMMGASIEPGRVILGVPDTTMVDFFKQQFQQFAPAMDLVPAVGPQGIIQTVQQAMQLAPIDFVLMHPQFLQDQGPQSLLSVLQSQRQRVCIFGWGAASPYRQLIEQSSVDGYVEGPSFGTGINAEQLISLIRRMQDMRKAGGAIPAYGQTMMRSGSMTPTQQGGAGTPTGQGGQDNEVLSQLMGEIIRLKSELNDQV
eukprot:TRINITY_DN9231_c0_g1_i1.p1 TRINITY_DN9231_c0_g1~~TRINITY_DN9231_c0_g1_i1.p1  ORF type:complete len:554 (+),score=89.72 TRINITY_DN9231_c0_g1_i1:195-1856(+)